MRGKLVAVAAVAATALVGLGGCRNQYSVQRPLAATEPPLLIGSGDSLGGGLAATPAPAQSVTVVERHPLLSRPQQYYNSTNGGKLAKTASATFIGVPAGIVGEVRQIVVGQAPAQTLP